MRSTARLEREALCDLFLEVGPDAPTLAGSWTTRDLAAHLVVRERRPDAAAGIAVDAAARHGERVRLAEADRPWPELVERVRSGPPVWSPMRLTPIDDLANSVEFFVHHEDVRRARPGWTVRQLPVALGMALDNGLRRMGWMLTRAAKVGIVAEPEGRPSLHLHRGNPVVTIRGPVGECVLYAYGRKDVARVTLHGPDAAVDQVRTARLGL